MFLLVEDNTMRIFKSIILFIISLSFIGIIVIFEIKSLPVGSSISGLLLGFSLPALCKSVQDISDTTNWKMSHRKLKRGGVGKTFTVNI